MTPICEPPVTAIYLELGAKRVIASARDWPGWCRSGKDEDQALAALVAVAPRYEAVAREAGFAFPNATIDSWKVVERLPGSATTDFGAPAGIAVGDSEPLTPEEAARVAALVVADAAMPLSMHWRPSVARSTTRSSLKSTGSSRPRVAPT